MMRILILDKLGTIKTDPRLEELTEALKNPTNVIWVDMHDVENHTVEMILGDMFGFHALAIDDALHETHVPKVDDWHDYLYIVLRAAALTNHNTWQLEVPELDIFLGDRFIVTSTYDEISAVDRVWNQCQQGEHQLQRGVDYVLYLLEDELVTEAIKVVEHMHDELDDIEEQIFGEAPQDVLEDLFRLKRNILKLRRITVPQREVLSKLSRNEYHVLKAADRVYFLDVYDHLIRLNDLLEEMLILVGSALDTYLSVVNNRMNDIMKTLTIITALFMPLAFITGFFGMNFFQAVVHFRTWTGITAFIVVMGLIVLIPLIMFSWMRRSNWI